MPLLLVCARFMRRVGEAKRKPGGCRWSRRSGVHRAVVFAQIDRCGRDRGGVAGTGLGLTRERGAELAMMGEKGEFAVRPINHLDNPLTLKIGHEQLVIRRRYETLSILNDFLVALWFFVGSVFFLYPRLVHAGTWLFIVGSLQLIIRPTIRLLAHVHLQRIPPSNWES